MLLELVRPHSVVDVGCGTGSWLAEFRERGVDDVLGIDGERVADDLLEIPRDRFLVHDLVQPLSLGRRFDLCICLEVGEHLPADEAPALVGTLAELAPVVFFSAAVPFQPGTGHVNGRWPAYWAEQFRRRGFLAADCVRMRLWDDERVRYFYAQNAILYVDRDEAARFPALESALSDDPPPGLVHPKLYESAVTSFPPADGVAPAALARFAARLAASVASRAGGPLRRRRR